MHAGAWTITSGPDRIGISNSGEADAHRSRARYDRTCQRQRHSAPHHAEGEWECMAPGPSMDSADYSAIDLEHQALPNRGYLGGISKAACSAKTRLAQSCFPHWEQSFAINFTRIITSFAPNHASHFQGARKQFLDYPESSADPGSVPAMAFITWWMHNRPLASSPATECAGQSRAILEPVNLYKASLDSHSPAESKAS